MSAHTPGPWTVVPNYSSLHYVLWDADGNYHDMTDTVAEMNANAALIAAAPDLLAALKGASVKAQDAIDWVESVGTRATAAQWRAKSAQIIHALRGVTLNSAAALAQAEGRS